MLVIHRFKWNSIIGTSYYTPRKQSCGGIKWSLCPFVRSFVRSSVRPSQSLIRYSSKTTEQNFMKLSGIVHYMMPYCTSYFKFLSAYFWVSQSKTRTLPYKTWGSGGYHFVSIANSISSFFFSQDWQYMYAFFWGNCKLLFCSIWNRSEKKSFFFFVYETWYIIITSFR